VSIPNKNSPDLIVIGTSTDPHINAVLDLIPPSYKVFRFDVDRFPKSIKVNIDIRNSGITISVLSDKDRVLLLDLSLVWFRRLGAPGVDDRIIDRAQRNFALGETEAFISGLVYLLKDAKWISPFESTKRATSKPYQLKMALECELQIPQTVISNNPEDALKFISESSKCIYKTMLTPNIKTENARSLIFTHLIEPNDCNQIDQVKHTPCQFQHYIEKAYELRITYIGGQFHPVIIYSQDQPDTSIDWRAGEWRNHRYEITSLPQDIEYKLKKLMIGLDLNYGAIDMIVTPDNQYVFLEVNPHGAWLWLEKATGIPIAKSFSNYICHSISELR
jgi:hypothetical protein